MTTTQDCRSHILFADPATNIVLSRRLSYWRPMGWFIHRPRFYSTPPHHNVSPNSGVRRHKVILSFLFLTALCGCKARNSFKAPPPPDVGVQSPIQRDVTEYLYATGQMASTKSVDLVARVQGFVQEIDYRDGDYVHKGDLLFLIEPSPYAAQLDQSQANLASAEARAAFDRQQFSRYSALARIDSTSVQQAQQTRSDRDTSNASVVQARAALKQAQINYSYTHVVAPFDGFVTAHQVNVGELVGGSQATELAQIVNLNPIWINFNISEQDATKVRGHIGYNGNNENVFMNKTRVEVELDGETEYSHVGHLDYISPQVDPTTGTLSLRGTFDNPDHGLRPGNFARVRIVLGVHRNALLVPTDCIGNDQGGRTLFIVTPDNKVAIRSVTIGAQEGDFQVIESGLALGDRVLVDSLQSVRSGEKIVPHGVNISRDIGSDGKAP